MNLNSNVDKYTATGFYNLFCSVVLTFQDDKRNT